MKQLVIDAGPLIGLFYAKDTDHAQCVAGFTQLIQAKTILLTPIPIVFEVYKWLLQRTSPQQAQKTLQVMQDSLHLIPVEKTDFDTLQAFVLALPQWQGTLEDAIVITTALRYRCPVWTLNYRDFGTFKTLEFWTPNSY
ncbi:MAG: type II toxin-antitoxin system VapC family toxin [Leptolyngbyaceae cyanobacterium bins.302]|nr:type II toxin-antitoxin system VapC family toxin [Leptolyngbyaceae cyanobacterium bins.302]